MTRRTRWGLTAFLIVSVAVAGALAWRSRVADAAAPQAAPTQVVGVIRAVQRDVPVLLDATGSVVSLNSVDVRPQVSSTVREVAIKEGQFVKQGDLLISFDDRADRANLEKARAQVLKDRAALADADRQYKRAVDLKEQNFVSQSAVDTASAAVDAARAVLSADEAAVHSGEVSLSYNAIRAPLTGRAGAINVYPGSLVQPNTVAPLVSISQIDPIGVSFTLPESQLAAVLEARHGGHKVQVSATPSGTGTPVQGELSFVDNTVDATSGTIRLKAVFPNAAQRLWPGQYVTVKLTLETLKDAVVVPQAALILRGTDRMLYTVDESGRAQQRNVGLRYSQGEFAVVSGISAGDRVVVDGKQNLRPGVAVREAAPAVAPKASAASEPSAGSNV
ncbi:MAG TPA: efflux RND transporter periplasmic adaptor subunit [Burkholderiaceae bacterium]|jgi:RND family efflux transporter MFP subunit|nr:efflux RND transporter periplasmic adaptor subunit [Burkholderiaceae bacterium]